MAVFVWRILPGETANLFVTASPDFLEKIAPSVCDFKLFYMLRYHTNSYWKHVFFLKNIENIHRKKQTFFYLISEDICEKPKQHGVSKGNLDHYISLFAQFLAQNKRSQSSSVAQKFACYKYLKGIKETCDVMESSYDECLQVCGKTMPKGYLRYHAEMQYSAIWIKIILK